MTLVEHIQELRRRLLISIAALAVGTVLGFIWYQHSFFGIISLGELLRGPYCNLPASARADFSNDGTCKLLATAPFEMFMLRLKVGSLAGLVLSSPVWLLQIWGFITPGLMKNEKRWTFFFVTSAVALFVVGAALAYFIVSFGLEFLLTIGQETQVTALTGDLYFKFLLALLLVFGVSFEVPLFIVILNIIGILQYATLKDRRRAIIVGIFIFAAFLTPGQEVYSMITMSVALCILVEMALQFCRFNDKRRGKRRPDWLDADDESPSKLDLTPSGVEGPTPVDAVTPVNSTPPSMIRGNEHLGDISTRPDSSFDDVL
ncbi:twin-arginine translocase subunit TatC [Corynebacterium hindlerae]|nr:twin-arginine translocase subunit TatC [Corynebacterium hindlerae]